MINTLNKALALKIGIAILVVLVALFLVLRPKQESGNFTGTWQLVGHENDQQLVIENRGDHYSVDFVQTNHFFEKPQVSHSVFTVKETDPLIAEQGLAHLSLSKDKKELNFEGSTYHKASN